MTLQNDKSGLENGWINELWLGEETFTIPLLIIIEKVIVIIIE